MTTKSNDTKLLDPESNSTSAPGGTPTTEAKNGNAADDYDVDDLDDDEFTPLKEKTWSFSQSRRHVATEANGRTAPSADSARSVRPASGCKGVDHYLYCLIYAIVNVIIAVPGLFGYAAVIFNNPIYNPHMNALSKLLIFSSLVHQLGFLLFSSLSFAIGTVQDAGLIFLSTMANTIANTMKDDGHTDDEILSTTLALLCSCTAALGLVLIAMGKFKLADAVSYLPMPVIGGYLAFIGYFCVQAGTSLCIGKPMMSIVDWDVLFDAHNLLLAVPGLLAGLVLTLTSRLATNSGVLPLVMVAIPVLFYFILWICGTSLDEARDMGWVGETSPPVPVSDLLKLIDFRQVRWDLILEIIPTWFGMVFVVSFASCLDVAAISIDMGKPLDTNRELATVGIANFMSGMTLGFTGSYIFSQTIFTYRTGVHDRCVGFLIMCVYMYIVASPVNILEISPLFFLGSTLIFIGYDLMYEWLWEVRHQVFLSEYFIVWFTFVSIHVVGIDFGILIGVLIAICDQVLTTAQATGVNRVEKRSRAIYTPEDAKEVHDKAYSAFAPKIVTLEIIGNLFFGSSLNILNRIYEDIGLLVDDSHPPATLETISEMSPLTGQVKGMHRTSRITRPPQYVVLDLMGVTHLDASATRGCFLQLVKMAAKKDILVCASGVTPKIEWMFRSHEVSYETLLEEDDAKAKLLSTDRKKDSEAVERILIFSTSAEALEFCETLLLRSANVSFRAFASMDDLSKHTLEDESREHTISSVLTHFLGCSGKKAEILDRLLNLRHHREVVYKPDQIIFSKHQPSDAFYVVLNGTVASCSSSSKIQTARQLQPVMSGAGMVSSIGSSTHSRFVASGQLAIVWYVGGIFGFSDYILGRPRTFETVAVAEGTRLAKFNRSDMNALETQDPELFSIMQQVLLRASNLDLANCTCCDV